MAAHEQSLPVGFTMGDAAGIGPEIIVKTFAAGLQGPALVYGDVGIMQNTVSELGYEQQLRVEIISEPEACPNDPAIIPVLNRWQPLPENLPMGQVNAEAGRGAYEYLCHAIDDAMAQRIRAIVTAPLNKKAMQMGGVDFPGHTEILAERSGTDRYAMMLANPELRVLLVTIHVALADVPGLISFESELDTIRLADLACRQAGLQSPRIAVAGLNPHAGEDGRFGREEIEIITPAVHAARAEGLDVHGPLPGDTVFMRARMGEFDIVVAQYHDQGLIPVKYLGVEQGVNVTVGLPFIRTSVDHGTAYSIAGQGIADPTSLRTAYETALAMTAADSS